jgi:hypothetical protein
MEKLSWTCHVCGRERPDDKISVFSRTKVVEGTGVTYQENVRYCNDNPTCIEKAPTISFTVIERKPKIVEAVPHSGMDLPDLIAYWIKELFWRIRFWGKERKK